jgi:diguanylate cyclase (GGDEF)-like protein
MLGFSANAMSSHANDGTLFAVLVIDIDHFKYVNDTYGHAAGDDVIRQVASIIQAACRPTDRVARFGGEEFVAILRDVPLLQAGEVAERVRSAVDSAPVQFGSHTIRVTVSVGAAMVAQSDRDIQDVIQRADQALYEAKAFGRNRTCIAAYPQRAEQQHAA